MFTTREQATWLLILFGIVAVCAIPSVHPSLWQVAKTFFGPRLFIPFVLYSGVLVGVVFLAHAAGLWERDLVGATSLWFVVTGVSLFVRSGSTTGDPHFFRSHWMETVKFAALFEFFLNLHTFAVPVEVTLQLWLLFLGLMSAGAAIKDEHKRAATAFQTLLVATVLGLVALTVLYLTQHWNEIDRDALLRLLVLPIWLTAVSLTGVYVVALYTEYEMAFLRLWMANDQQHAALGSKLSLIMFARGRLRLIHSFGSPWSSELVKARSLRQALGVARAFRSAASRRA